MSTVIQFTSSNDSIAVHEDLEEVSQAFRVAGGGPLRLTRAGAGDPVLINPARIACWYPQRNADRGGFDNPVVLPRRSARPI